MSRSSRAGVLTATALSVAVAATFTASPAFAAPWDGNEVVFGPGEWEPYSSSFMMEDVYLYFPDTSTEYVDIWDGAGETFIDAPGLGITDEAVECDSDSDVDVETDAGTGDLVFTCEQTNASFGTAGLEVVAEMRILAGGEIVRFMTTITNTTGGEVTLDEVRIETDFGTSDQLWDYDNQSDGILAVPAPEDSGNYAQLNTAEALWIVHYNDSDAPGGLVMGAADSEAAGQWVDSGSSDQYHYSFPSLTIPAGEARSIVTFATWDPQGLIDGELGDTSDEEALLMSSADQVVADMAAFDSLDGVLANGITDTSTVVNWVPAADDTTPEEPELAETGAADVVGVALGALGLLAVGFVFALRRRSLRA